MDLSGLNKQLNFYPSGKLSLTLSIVYWKAKFKFTPVSFVLWRHWYTFFPPPSIQADDEKREREPQQNQPILWQPCLCAFFPSHNPTKKGEGKIMQQGHV